MQFINHPSTYKMGLRVLMLSGRYKDGISTQRKIFRVSKNEQQFNQFLLELSAIAMPNERIYATAAQRSIKKAARNFRTKQLNSEYDPDPMEFYENIEARWVSSLMQETSVERENKLWMFDCDTPEEIEAGTNYQEEGVYVHHYNTKNGVHVLILPQNKQLMPDILVPCLQTNPLMLWGY